MSGTCSVITTRLSELIFTPVEALLPENQNQSTSKPMTRR
jgi:hypothetical protein